jgi:hypothetical protein
VGLREFPEGAEFSGTSRSTRFRQESRHPGCVIAIGEVAMIDREQLETLLANRFSGATREQIAAAANAIMAMVRAAGNPPDDGESPGSPCQAGRHRNCLPDLA